MHSNESDPSNRNTLRITQYWTRPKSVPVGALSHATAQPGDPLIPCLKLRGMWMRQTGIDVGRRVTVELFDGAILLRLAEPNVSVELKALKPRKRLRKEKADADAA